MGLRSSRSSDLGILQKFLVSPSPRAALVMGKALSAGVRALSQAVIIYALSFLLGVKINWHPLALLGVVLVVFLGAAIFATFSLIVACIVKTRERIYGNRRSPHDAPVFCKQRDLSNRHHAAVAASHRPRQPAHLPCRCVADADAGGRDEPRTCRAGYFRSVCGHGCDRVDRCEDVSKGGGVGHQKGAQRKRCAPFWCKMLDVWNLQDRIVKLLHPPFA